MPDLIARLSITTRTKQNGSDYSLVLQKEAWDFFQVCCTDKMLPLRTQ